MFENKNSGIFALLDQECKMPSPRNASFMANVTSMHKNCSAFSNQTRKNTNSFAIYHFGQEVLYDTVSTQQPFKTKRKLLTPVYIKGKLH